MVRLIHLSLLATRRESAGTTQHNRECFLPGPPFCASRVEAARRGIHVIVPCISFCHLPSKSFTGPAGGFSVGESAASGGAPSLLAACAVLGLSTMHGTHPCLSPIPGRGTAGFRPSFLVVRRAPAGFSKVLHTRREYLVNIDSCRRTAQESVAYYFGPFFSCRA